MDPAPARQRVAPPGGAGWQVRARKARRCDRAGPAISACALATSVFCLSLRPAALCRPDRPVARSGPPPHTATDARRAWRGCRIAPCCSAARRPDVVQTRRPHRNRSDDPAYPRARYRRRRRCRHLRDLGHQLASRRPELTPSGRLGRCRRPPRAAAPRGGSLQPHGVQNTDVIPTSAFRRRRPVRHGAGSWSGGRSPALWPASMHRRWSARRT